MAFARINTGVAANTGSGLSLAASAFDATAGNLIVGGFSHEGTLQTLTPSDTGGDTFTKGTEESHSGVGQWTQSFYDLSCNTQAANAVTATTPSATTYRGISVAQYSAAAAIEFDVQNTGEAGGVTGISVAVTTTGAAGVIHATAKKYSSGGTFTGAGDATLIAAHGNYHAHFEKITTSAGSYTMTANSGATDSFNLTVIAFKEAGGGGPRIPSNLTGGMHEMLGGMQG